MFNNILVVCVGNICRSPTGEHLLKNLCKDKNIDSAGISALVGHDIDKVAKEVASENDLAIERHIAKQLTLKLCSENDLILVMEKKHFEKVCSIAPEARGKIMLFGQWTSQEIPDPYRRSKETFQQVYQMLESAAVAWSKKLK